MAQLVSLRDSRIDELFIADIANEWQVLGSVEIDASNRPTALDQPGGQLVAQTVGSASNQCEWHTPSPLTFNNFSSFSNFTILVSSQRTLTVQAPYCSHAQSTAC